MYADSVPGKKSTSVTTSRVANGSNRAAGGSGGGDGTGGGDRGGGGGGNGGRRHRGSSGVKAPHGGSFRWVRAEGVLCHTE